MVKYVSVKHDGIRNTIVKPTLTRIVQVKLTQLNPLIYCNKQTICRVSDFGSAAKTGKYPTSNREVSI